MQEARAQTHSHSHLSGNKRARSGGGIQPGGLQGWERGKRVANVNPLPVGRKGLLVGMGKEQVRKNRPHIG